MHATAGTRTGLIGLMALGTLFALYGLHLIGSGLVLAGLGALALAGYLRDRAGCGALLAPAGVLLGLGAGLVLSDLAHGLPVAWAGAVGLFGLGLLGIYLTDRRHGWALGFGGLLALASVVILVALLRPVAVLAGLGVATAGVAGSLALLLRRPPAPAASAAKAGHR
jgi:hypothetical protein